MVDLVPRDQDADSAPFAASSRDSRVLLLGPYDPHCGEYTFLSPPLGVWRLAGHLQSEGVHAEVFDPNCCDGRPEKALEDKLRESRWDIIGVSTTGMTLRYDLALAHLARKSAPDAVIVAGGMEATFKPELMFRLGPFDLVVLGEGEKPLVELVDRISAGSPYSDIAGTAFKNPLGWVTVRHGAQLTRDELRDAIARTPYESMPYQDYWRRLEEAYWVDDISVKAEREMRLAEIRSVRLITLNYCPMNCTFCSSTNFLHAAQGSTAPIARLDAEECVEMIKRIVSAQPGVRTVIFQDDIFVFTKDKRILPLCNRIIEEKQAGNIPSDLQFISTNRIDAMTPERLAAMRQAGFRVLGFGVESFSPQILKEFNKIAIYPHIEANLTEALRLGMTPFLDLILASPRCSIDDLALTLREAFKWLRAGCEVGVYPYVIPFSGAQMANDETLKPHTIYGEFTISGSAVRWQQAEKILPVDDVVRRSILESERRVNEILQNLQTRVAHIPSRLRSLLWVGVASDELARLGMDVPSSEEAFGILTAELPQSSRPFAASALITPREAAHAVTA